MPIRPYQLLLAIAVFCASSGLPIPSSAQSNPLEQALPTADAHPTQQYLFGDIAWNAPVAVNFVIQNPTPNALSVVNVETDCDCLTLSYEGYDLPPQGNLTLQVRYDARTLGTFQKSVRVYLSDNTCHTLTIIGRVVQEEKVSANLPVKMGNISLSTNYVEFNDVRQGEIPQRTIIVRNDGTESYLPALMHLPKYIGAYADPELLRPGRIGKLILTLNTNDLHSFGLTQSSVYLSRTNSDRVSRDNEILLSTILLPKLDSAALTRTAQPQLAADSLVNLGSFAKKSKLSGKVLLRNLGNANLQISRLQVYNSGLRVSLSKSLLRPGEQAELKITVLKQANQLRGAQRILLISNDPLRQKFEIAVKTDS